MYNVVDRIVVVYFPKLRERSQCFQGILLERNVMGILERQWSRMKSYVIKWKHVEELCD